MAKTFIILLNWNNWEETRECLGSLERLDYAKGGARIVVVDNGSTNGDAEKVRRFCLSPKPYTINPIFNDANLGFAGGNNVGIRYALEQRADYVVLLNNDAVVAPDFLTHLVQVAESEPSYGVLGSRIYKHNTSEVVFDGGVVSKWLIGAEHANIAGADPAISQIKKVDYITGAAMLVKREVIEKIGLMREEYFLYYEDVDWCLRARRAGRRCGVVQASRIWHKVSATNKEGSPSYIYYHTRNALMLAKFNGNILQKTAAYFIGAWILAKQMPKFVFMSHKKIWASSMAKGVLDFYRGKYGTYEDRD